MVDRSATEPKGGMSPVALTELPPDVRAKVMKQLGAEQPLKTSGSRQAGEIRMRVTDLHPHPMNVRVYGLLETNAEFLESIERWGVMEPIVYQPLSFDAGQTFQNTIISGHRRFLAATTFKMEDVPVKLAFPDHAPICEEDDLLAVEELVIESNRQRVKTAEQVGREYQELKRIQSGLAAVREKSGRATLGKDFHTVGKARDIAAAPLGISGRTAEKISKIIEAADSGNETAKEALRQMNQERGKIKVETGFRMVFKPKEHQKSIETAKDRRQLFMKTVQQYPELASGFSTRDVVPLAKTLASIPDRKLRDETVKEFLAAVHDHQAKAAIENNPQAEQIAREVRHISKLNIPYSPEHPSVISALRQPNSPHHISRKEIQDAISEMQIAVKFGGVEKLQNLEQTLYGVPSSVEQPQEPSEPPVEPEPPKSPEPQHKSRMTLLREWFGTQYGRFELRSDERSFRRMGFHDLRLWGLTPRQVKAIGKLLAEIADEKQRGCV